MVTDVMMIAVVIVLITRILIMVAGRGGDPDNGRGDGCDCANSDAGCISFQHRTSPSHKAALPVLNKFSHACGPGGKPTRPEVSTAF